MRSHANIRKTIAERQETSRAIHRRIRDARGLERHELWLEKRRYGVETRHLLLAYARLRGMPYANVERHSTHPPSASAIADLVMLHGGPACDADDIRRWLAPPSEEARV